MHKQRSSYWMLSTEFNVILWNISENCPSLFAKEQSLGLSPVQGLFVIMVVLSGGELIIVGMR